MNTGLFRVVKLVLNFSLFNTLYVSLFIEREPKMHYEVCIHIYIYIYRVSLKMGRGHIGGGEWIKNGTKNSYVILRYS